MKQYPRGNKLEEITSGVIESPFLEVFTSKLENTRKDTVNLTLGEENRLDDLLRPLDTQSRVVYILLEAKDLILSLGV